MQAQFCLALADRDVPRAVQAIDDYYAAAALYWQDPFQTNEGCSCAHMATYELMLLVSQHALTDEQIARLDARLDALASSFRMRDSILAQRAELLALLDSYGDSDSPFYRNKALPECYFPLLVMEEQAFLMRYTSELARVADLPGPAGLQAASDLQQQYDQIPERFKVVADFFSFRPTSFRTMSLAPRQCLQNARVGIRVDRHLRKHGRLPGSFSEVLDDRLTEPPKCLFSGLPLILKPDQEGGFVIYAPGDNGIDNGAELGPNRDHQEIAYAFYVRYPPGMKRSKP
ncbi:MAG: hypothetical protein HYS13_24145 [Planctomycetia bacterium]|nr:hypothetical protein [Planctomycetia bacterium]